VQQLQLVGWGSQAAAAAAAAAAVPTLGPRPAVAGGVSSAAGWRRPDRRQQQAKDQASQPVSQPASHTDMPIRKQLPIRAQLTVITNGPG
jgi:hypothetical protein